jgi:hypothetical protein
MPCETDTTALLRRPCRATLETMRRTGMTLEQFDAQVAHLKEQALARRSEVFPELWLMVNVCSGQSAKYILGADDAKPFVYVKRHIDRWDEIKAAGQAVAAAQRKRPFYTHADAVAYSLERTEHNEGEEPFQALKPWVAITGVAFPAGGAANERLAWYRDECYYAQLVQHNHLRGMRFNLLVTNGDMSAPYEVCTLRCPQCGRIVTDAARVSPHASHEEHSQLKLAEMRGELLGGGG